MNIYKQFTPNLSSIDLDYGNGVTFTVAYAGESNLKYAETRARLMKPYQKGIKAETFTEQKAREVLAEVYADTIILGWGEGVTDKDGNPLPFNRENCIKILIDIPNLFADIREQTANISLFREEALEEDAKN